MCFGGGGSTTNNSFNQQIAQQNDLIAQQNREAQAFQAAQIDFAMHQEAMANANRSAAFGSVNNAFSNRPEVYRQFAGATYQLNKDEIDRMRGDTTRDTGFALARSGLSGGSADVDKHREIQDRYNTALTNARSYAVSQGDALRAQDEQLRQAMLGMAASGVVGPEIASGLSGRLAQSPQPAVMPTAINAFSGIADAIGRTFYQLGYGGGAPIPGGSQYSSYHPNTAQQGDRGTVIS